MIFVGQSAGKGRGIFTQSSIHSGALIEAAPVIVMSANEVEFLDKTALQDYYFLWGTDEKEAAIMLGLCSLCNHSYEPNAMFNLNPARMMIEFFAIRDIEAGEEITVNYNGDPASQKPIWFDVLPER